MAILFRDLSLFWFRLKKNLIIHKICGEYEAVGLDNSCKLRRVIRELTNKSCERNDEALRKTDTTTWKNKVKNFGIGLRL